MKKHHESHLDHNLTDAQIAYIFERYADRNAFFVETLELPPELGTVPCGLWGPSMDDEPIDGRPFMLSAGDYIMPAGIIAERHLDEDLSINFGSFRWVLPTFDGAITWAKRGARGWDSRLINAPTRPDRRVTVIGGPHENYKCILYTAYGGPAAPQEPSDPKLKPENPNYAKAVAFWNVHALSRYAT